MNTIKIKELYSVEQIDLTTSMFLTKAGMFPQELEKEGVTVSVKVPYPMWCSKEKALDLNREAYNSIDAHRGLFTFVRSYGIRSLEELCDNPYSNWCIWVKIKDRMAANQNCLILTHGLAPDRKEAYYNAKDYNEFWDIVERLTDMYDNPGKEHSPITLKQKNGMCGSSYKEWELSVI